VTRPPHCPRRDPKCVRITQSYRIHPRTAAAIKAEADRAEESQGQVLDRLAERIHKETT